MYSIQRKIVVLLLIVLSLLFCSCSSISNFASPSTPEETYESMHKAIANKDYDMFYRSFSTEGTDYTDENLQILAKRMFYKTKVKSHKVITKELETDHEARLVVEEILERPNGIKSKAKAAIIFVKINKVWKIAAYKNISLEPN